MSVRHPFSWPFFLIASLLVTVATPPAFASGARNVILIIGDGMDDQQITIARNYLVGARGKLLLDRMPLRSVVQVLTVTDEEAGKAVYVADSANTATSMASGVVTSRGRIGTSAGSDVDVTSIVELAHAAGMKTGIVSTSSVTDATPAAFFAHVSRRDCENPDTILGSEVRPGIRSPGCPADLKRNGGLGSISEQAANSNLDVVLGGGAKHFTPIAEGETRSVRDVAAGNGFHVITEAAQLRKVPAGKKLLGIFADNHISVRLRGEDARIAVKPDRDVLNRLNRFLGSVQLPDPMRCEAEPGFAAVPSLKMMTDVALSQLSNNGGKGFFLAIESALIDKQSHVRNPCGSIGELEQLNEAVASALEYAERDPETLILVTSDHGHAAQVVPNESLFDRYGIPVFTPGRLARLVTRDGAILAVSYATNSFRFEEHTGVNVPLYANRVGHGRVPSMVTQPEIFDIMVEYLGLNRALAQGGPGR